MDHNKQQRITATNIGTNQFNKIIEFLRNNEWELIAEYNDQLYDKGIDFDFYQFTKKSNEILLAWNNWNEGEIQASKEVIYKLAYQLNVRLQFGNPEYLHQEDFLEAIHALLKYY